MKPLLLIPLLLTSLFLSANAQQGEWKDPDEILIENPKRPKVLLVGSFHFNYPNLDAHKVDKKDQLDILSPEKQREVEELVDYIARFRPTKIMVEAGRNTGYLVNDYKRWLAGEPIRRDETRQIGFRLMKRLGLDTLYGVNSASLLYDMYHSEDSAQIEFVEKLTEGYDYQSDDPWSKRYTEFYDYETQMTLQASLLDNFKYMNSEKVLRRSWGAYLVGDFRIGEQRGADVLAIGWYDRNLRIYRNIQRIETDPEDRILVLFGAGHIPILKNLFESCPEFELVHFDELETNE
jgi:hypothetical protein